MNISKLLENGAYEDSFLILQMLIFSGLQSLNLQSSDLWKKYSQKQQDE